MSRRIRRALVVTGLAVAVAVGAAVPASAAFDDRTAAVATAVGTLTVDAPTGLTLADSCVTTTRTVKHTVHTHPGNGARTTTSYSSSTTTSTSSRNVQGTSSTTEPGPGPHETTTTTVTKNTNLHVTLRWTGSTTRGVTGYVVSAHLGINDSVAPLLHTPGTQVSAVQDADRLDYQPSLVVTTETGYGWTADSTRTRVLSC